MRLHWPRRWSHVEHCWDHQTEPVRPAYVQLILQSPWWRGTAGLPSSPHYRWMPSTHQDVHPAVTLAHHLVTLGSTKNVHCLVGWQLTTLVVKTQLFKSKTKTEFQHQERDQDSDVQVQDQDRVSTPRARSRFRCSSPRPRPGFNTKSETKIQMFKSKTKTEFQHQERDQDSDVQVQDQDFEFQDLSRKTSTTL